jgi:hypothetical protein
LDQCKGNSQRHVEHRELSEVQKLLQNINKLVIHTPELIMPAKQTQCLKWRTLVNTMARPAASAAAITS